MLQVTERCMIVNMVLTTHHARFASRTVLVTAILMQVRETFDVSRNQKILGVTTSSYTWDPT